mmetsp:Transcript_51362/g.122244  ORF Transcript_51362/g.122244 Transcript_51362/m.122244 type:complete len:323 (+) Transcript_51362:647-1615(+)
MAPAPSNDSIAAPIAVSSWNTLWESASEGSTVFEFLIIGSGTTPSFFSMTAWSLSRRIQRLLVLKYLCFSVSWKSFSSSSAHWADSRRRRWLSCLRTARCPPFLSDDVRSHTSMTKDLSDSTKKARRLRSSVAPRLSAFDTNMYFTPASRSFLSSPEPAREGYRSPCPGGHHSFVGLPGSLAGRRVSAWILGTLFWTTSQPSATISGETAESATFVSALVEKEFMNMTRTLPRVARNAITCLAMMARKDSPFFTWSSDFACSRPMPVPNPPLSLRTTVCSSIFLIWSSGRLALTTSAREGRSPAGEIARSEIIPSSPRTSAS